MNQKVILTLITIIIVIVGLSIAFYAGLIHQALAIVGFIAVAVLAVIIGRRL